MRKATKRRRLRYRTAKREAFDRANADWRRDYIEERGHCALCGCKEGETHPDGHYAMSLTVHELCPGAFRLRSIEQGRDACMVVCWFCNSVKLPGMKLAKQIAAKALDERARYTGSGQRYMPAGKIQSIIAAVRAVKDNGRAPVIVTEAEVLALIK